MRNKELIINMIASILSLVISIGMNFYLTPYLVRNVGDEAYGFYSLANKFVDYSAIITLALNSMACRFITIKIHKNEMIEANEYFNSVLISNIIISIFLTIPAFIIIVYGEKILGISKFLEKDVKFLFILIFLNAIIGIVGSVFSVSTFVKNKLYLSSLREIESNIIKILVLIVLFSILVPRVSYLGIAIVISGTFIFVTNIFYTKRLLPEISIKKSYFNFNKVKTLISLGIWNSITKLSQILLDGLDLLITNILIGVSEMGTLAIVKTIPSFLAIFMGKIVTVFTPKITEYYAKEEFENVIKEINNANKMQIILLSIPIGFTVEYGKIFYELWMPSKDAEILQMLSVISILVLVVSASIQSLYHVFTLTNKVKVNSIVMIITGILNTIIVLTLLIKTDLGLLAVTSVSTVLGIIRNLTFTPIYASKCLKVKWNTFYYDILKGIIAISIVIILAKLSTFIFVIDSWISLIFIGFISAIIAIIINIVIVLNSEDRRKLFNYIKNRLGIK